MSVVGGAVDAIELKEPGHQLEQVPGALRRIGEELRSHPVGIIYLTLVLAAVLLMIIGPWITPFDPTSASADVNLAPSGQHLFGTDSNGTDVLSETIAAFRIDIGIGLAGAFSSFLLGTVFGVFVSLAPRRIGEACVRVSDTVQAFPVFVLSIIVVVFTGRHIGNIILVIAILNSPIFLRITRAEVMTVLGRTYIEAARAIGESEISLARRHVIPNSIGPGIAQVTTTIGWSIIVASGLSFVGAGVLPPTPEWGAMISDGSNGIIIGQWWISVFPGAVMAITVFAFTGLGGVLQNAVSRQT
jgi:peptide/nickel transport system permease protein